EVLWQPAPLVEVQHDLLDPLLRRRVQLFERRCAHPAVRLKRVPHLEVPDCRGEAVVVHRRRGSAVLRETHLFRVAFLDQPVAQLDDASPALTDVRWYLSTNRLPAPLPHDPLVAGELY